MGMGKVQGRTTAVMLATAAATVAMMPLAATALAATPGSYSEWNVSGDSGTVTIHGEGFPRGVISSNSTSLVAPSGKSTFLNGSTPFGQEFGSSRDRGYLVFRTASGKAPSTTTITFDSLTPAGGWGFVLGDIDADKAKVTATGDDGKTLATADLGWKGAFNYCEGSPLPPVCGGKTDSDKPTWDEADSTLRGHVNDTNGASGWFMPNKPVKKLTIVYSVLSGIPVGQLWIAAKPWQGEREIRIVKTAWPRLVVPGGTVTYKITVTNHGTLPQRDAAFRDDLAGVLDDARYENDAHATGGTVSYRRPVLSWHGNVEPGQTQTITYSVRIYDPARGDGVIRNAVIGEGSRETCPRGRGDGCVATVQVLVFCRAAVSGWPVTISRPVVRSSRGIAAC